MTYTFWHSGILIGESDLDERTDSPRRKAGAFRPTPYGLEVFPRLTGSLTAGHQLEAYLDANGLSPDDMGRDEIERVFDSTPAGQKILDIGRMLSEVEVHAPGGRRLEFASIAFIDLEEWEQVLRAVDVSSPADRQRPLSDPARYVVSMTLCEPATAANAERRLVHFPQRRWPDDN